MESIAIIGMACRFPGSSSARSFWELLRAGKTATSVVPPERWDDEKFYDPDPAAPGKHNARCAGYIERVDEFDAGFFGISPREAAWLDPQQRLALEVAAEALEDAGLPAEGIAGSKTGVFMGATSNDQVFRISQRAVLESISDMYAAMGITPNLISGRISYFYDLKGPSLTIDAACSSSLLAVHLACQSLAAGESTVAIAGGVTLMLSPIANILLAKTGAFAPDGLCKAFDARADGFVRGEGAGMVVLKPLRKAILDGDRIHAVVAGGAVVQDGRSNGMTAPSGRAQEELIREALRSAGISAKQVGYVEAHGTGTALGDPIEMIALGSAFLDDRSPEDKCPVGSVKTNIGHLEAAAGVAGLIKVVLALEHRELPPSLNFETPNPQIPFDSLPIKVQTARRPWPRLDAPLFAGVSSFGWSGTNCHLIVKEAPLHEAPASEGAVPGGPHLVPLSAATPDALRAFAASLRESLAAPSGDVAQQALRDIAASAATRRTHYAHRFAVVGSSSEELVKGLDALLRGEPTALAASGRKPPGRAPKIAFVFSGQGAEWVGMGRELMATEPAFRAEIERCEQVIQEYAGFSLIAELMADEASSRLRRVDVVQPVLFALQVSLAALWRSLGVVPSAVVGHSMGEVAAACCAGALELREGARVICHRSRLLHTLDGTGTMALVELSLEDAHEAIASRRGELSVAAVSSRRATVLSGDATALSEVLAELQARGVFCRSLNTQAAGHSHHMDPLLPQLLDALGGLAPRTAAVRFLSSVSTEWHEGSDLTPAYWACNLRQTVRFSTAIERMAREGYSVFLEISPHALQCGSIGDDLRELQRKGVAIPSLRRRAPERVALLSALGQLYCLGVPVVWSGVAAQAGGPFVPLPAYPWQRTRFPLVTAGEAATTDSRSAARGASPQRPLLGPPTEVAGSHETMIWEVYLDKRLTPALFDCRLGEVMVLPPSAYIEIGRAIAADILGTETCTIADVNLRRPLYFAEDGTPPRVQAVLSGKQGDEAVVSVYSHGAQGWILHTSLRVRPALDRSAPSLCAAPRHRRVDTLWNVGEELYRKFGEFNVQHGPSLRSVAGFVCDNDEASAELVLPRSAATGAQHLLHPAVLDGGLQLCDVLVLANLGDIRDRHAFIGTTIGMVQIFGPTGPRMWARARATARTEGRIEVDVTLVDERGDVAVELVGVRFQRMDVAISRATTKAPIEAPVPPSPQPTSGTALRLRAASSREARQAILLGCVTDNLAHALGCSASHLDAQQRLSDLGLDSLMGLEVRNRLEAALGLSLPPTLALRYPTIDALVAYLSQSWESGQEGILALQGTGAGSVQALADDVDRARPLFANEAPPVPA